jgi:hypothetical protein
MLPKYHVSPALQDGLIRNVHGTLFHYLTNGIDAGIYEHCLLRNPELKRAIVVQLKTILKACECKNWALIEAWVLQYPSPSDYWPIIAYIAFSVPLPTCWTTFLTKNGYPSTMTLSQVLQSRPPFHHDSFVVTIHPLFM